MRNDRPADPVSRHLRGGCTGAESAGGGEMKPAHYCQTLTHICTRKDIVSRGNYPNVISISCNDTLTIIGENASPKQLDAIMDILEKNGEEE